MHADGHWRAGDRRALTIALALAVAFALIEITAGWLADSLALLADAAHVAGDAAGLALALFALWIAAKPATPTRSYGYLRAEILAALANGVALVALAIWIVVEAYQRLRDPPDPLGGWVAAVGALGLVVNAGTAVYLHRAGSGSLNVRAALRHVVADALGSIGVVVAGVVVLVTGWAYADPLVSVLIALLVLASSWSVLRDSVSVLLETTPRGIDATAVGRAMAAYDGVREVHDLHIWTITSGFPALSAHVLCEGRTDCHALRSELERMLHDQFGLGHTTLQVEHAAGLLDIRR